MFQPEYERRLLRGVTAKSKEHLDLRCIPTRTGNQWTRNFTLSSYDSSELSENSTYAYLLRNEFLDEEISSMEKCAHDTQVHAQTGDFITTHSSRVYGFSNVSSPLMRRPFATISESSQRLLSISKRPIRRLPRRPYKILDAPELQDDFYLNLIDWSANNNLAVGLGCSVYLWSAVSGQVTRLCDFNQEDNLVTAVSWHGEGRQVAIGTQSGYVTIWDAERQKQINRLEGHSGRVTALAWRGNNLASGSRDRSILQRDVRTPPRHITRCLRGHKLEVCGLQWSPSNRYLASGGSDNQLLVWTDDWPEPIYSFDEHKAVVKALGWSPHKSGLLASGGGSADRCLRFWNLLTGKLVQCIDTGAQISNLAWARDSAELVTTHGHAQPQIVVWRYPSLKQVTRLSGHTQRVLHLSVSPDNESIVTGGADETVRFWTVFTKQVLPKEPKSVLSLFQDLR
ncbi:fizzy-related protein homolog [Drosophila eugracilis]|uniref:fizzy-related protein homolog n=1 Tax=Drosophila eugracilis TaxID=29029 RepID=UPI0007E5F33A|nr:fizzy-related protein homolog [Drosophila eugracilis]